MKDLVEQEKSLKKAAYQQALNLLKLKKEITPLKLSPH